MPDRPMTDERLEAALSTLGGDLAFPVTPAFAEAVTARLTSERAAGARPRLPSRALWSRRRVLVLVTIGLLAALALAAAARLAIGTIEIGIQPGVTPPPSLPPVEPDVLGDPLPAREAVALAGFEPSLPPGPPPDEVYVVDSPFGDPGMIYAWRPSATYPALPGTEWGLVLIAFQGDDETVVKTVQRFEDIHDASVNGERAWWIPVRHVLEIETDAGFVTFSVRGNVLIWEVADVTYRLETSLDRASAIALAESMT
jgi:hypothetical protein